MRSSGERDASGKLSISRVVTVPPTTVRVVSTCVPEASTTITASTVTPAGFKRKSSCRVCAAIVVRFVLSSVAKFVNQALML